MLKKAWQKWLVVARAIGNFQAQVILTIFYFLLIWPLGIVFRLFGDPLRLRSGQALSLRKKTRSNFEAWEHPKENLEEARRQY